MRGTPLTALQPQMADSPSSNLGAATKENLKNRLSRCNFQFPITISEYQTLRQPVFKVFLAVRQAWGTKAVSSSVPVCRSLLRSKPTPKKKQRAQPVHHSKCFACFCHELSSPNTGLALCALIFSFCCCVVVDCSGRLHMYLKNMCLFRYDSRPQSALIYKERMK